MFRLFILALVLGIGFFLLVDTIAKSLLEKGIRADSKMDVNIGDVDVGMTSSTLRLDDLKLYNTSEFGGGTFIDIGEIYLEFDPKAAMRRNLDLKLVRFELDEIVVIRNGSGKLNLEGLKDLFDQGKIGFFKFQGIKTLNVSLRKLRYVDLLKPENSKEFDLGIEGEILHDVHSWKDLSPLIYKILLKQGTSFLKSILDFQ